MSDKQTNRNQTKKSQKRWGRRLLRLLFFLFLSVLVCIITVSILLYYLYPTEKLKKMAIEAVAQNANRTLHLGDAYLHPWRGFVFNEVRLTLPGDTLAANDVFPLRSAYFKKIELKYSLRHLLRRKLLIKEINFQSPQLELFVDMTTPSVIDFAALMKMDFGLKIQLSKFLFENAKFKIILGYAQLVQNIYIDHFSCYFDSVQLPRGGIAQNDSLFRAKIMLTSKKSKCIIEQINLADGTNQSAQVVADVDLLFDVSTFADLQLRLEALLRDFSFSETTIAKKQQMAMDIPMFFNLGLHADLKQEKAYLDSLSFGFENTPWLRLTAQMDSIFTTTKVEAKIIESRIPIAQLWRLAQPWLSAERLPRLQLKNPYAYLSLTGTELKGSIKRGIDFTSYLHLTPLGITIHTDTSSLFLDGLAIDVNAKGVYSTEEGLKTVNLSIESRYDTLDVLFQQQPFFYTGHCGIKLQADLNQDFLPRLLNGQLAISNIMGGQLRGDLRLGTISSLANLNGSGYLRLYDIEIDRLFNAPLQGDAALRMDISVQTLNKIAAQLSLNTGSLTMPQEDEPWIFPPINFNMHSHLRLDSLLTQLKVDTLKIELNDILSARLDGSFLLDERIVSNINVQDIILNHPAIMEFIPETLRQRWSEPQFSGKTHLRAQIHATMEKDGEIVYNAKGHLFSSDASFYAPSAYLALVGLNLNADIAIDSHQGGQFGFQLQLDSLRNNALGTVSFAQNRMRFHLKSADFNSFEIEDGVIELPDLFLNGQFSAAAKHLNTNPQLQAHIHLKQDVHDTLRLPLNMRMIGKSDFQFDLKMDSSSAKVRTEIWTDALTLFVSQNAALTNMQAQLSISQNIDLLQKRLVSSPAYVVNTPSSALMDYFVYRGYYQHEALPRSYIKIARIDFADYRIEDVFLELFVKDGRLEIPAFMAKMYGGNIAGRMAINLAGGDLSRTEYTINAHFTNINSNLILPRGRGETQKGIINGNLDLQGTGIDPNSEFNVQGQIYLTEIGPKVADNILRSLDPQGKDSGIRTTRLLLNRGFKPKLMTFVLRHGYLYPTIIFNQPWYLPIRLSGGRVELARIPIEFFIKSRS